MTSPQRFVAPTCLQLADLLSSAPDEVWDAQSLCEKWRVRHVVAHVTMPVRLTPQAYGAELADAGGDFGVLSDRVALRDGALPVDELLDQLRSPKLHSWEPPGGGPAGAMTHAVIHSLDVTIALGREPAASTDARVAVLDVLTSYDPPLFGVDLTQVRLEADDADRAWGEGAPLVADTGSLVALLGGRTLPDGRALPRA